MSKKQVPSYIILYWQHKDWNYYNGYQDIKEATRQLDYLKSDGADTLPDDADVTLIESEII